MHSYGQRVRKRRRGVEQDVSAAGRAAKVRAYPPQAPRPHAAVRAADPGRAVRQATTRAASQRGDADAAVGGAAPGADGTSLLSSVMRGAESLFSGREGASKAHSATKTAPLDGSREVAPASQGESAGGDGLSQLSEADLVDHSLACLGDIQLNTPCVSPFPRLGRPAGAAAALNAPAFPRSACSMLRRASSGDGRSRSRRSGRSAQPAAPEGSEQGEGHAHLDRAASDAAAPSSPPQRIAAADVAGSLPVADVLSFESPFSLGWIRTSTAEAACGAMTGVAQREPFVGAVDARSDASQAAAEVRGDHCARGSRREASHAAPHVFADAAQRGAALRAALGTWVFPADEMPVAVAREAAKAPDPGAQRAWARQRGATLAGAAGARTGHGSVPSCMDVRRGKWCAGTVACGAGRIAHTASWRCPLPPSTRQGAVVFLCNSLCAGRVLSFSVEFPAIRVVGVSWREHGASHRCPVLTLSGSTRGLRSRLRAQGAFVPASCPSRPWGRALTVERVTAWAVLLP